jgi:hypothetical protein
MNLSQIEIQKKITNFALKKRLLYTEAESAMKVNGTTIKKPLENSPFILFSEYGYGASKEGCWTCDYMYLQFEDCVDTIQALYPEYDTIWLFDHICGHDHGRE